MIYLISFLKKKKKSKKKRRLKPRKHSQRKRLHVSKNSSTCSPGVIHPKVIRNQFLNTKKSVLKPPFTGLIALTKGQQKIWKIQCPSIHINACLRAGNKIAKTMLSFKIVTRQSKSCIREARKRIWIS